MSALEWDTTHPNTATLGAAREKQRTCLDPISAHLWVPNSFSGWTLFLQERTLLSIVVLSWKQQNQHTWRSTFINFELNLTADIGTFFSIFAYSVEDKVSPFCYCLSMGDMFWQHVQTWLHFIPLLLLFAWPHLSPFWLVWRAEWVVCPKMHLFDTLYQPLLPSH